MAKFVVVGATGFIGRHVVATLLERRHTVVGVHRGKTPPSLDGQSRFESIKADLTKMQKAEGWTPILEGADAVINCAGLLQASKSKMTAVHTSAPKALFDACTKADVRRVIQISAISTDANTVYAATKRQADEALAKTDLDWVIVRPSLVYGHGSYGGTSLMRGLAACPGAVPLVADGSQKFQPIYMGDLVGIICELCEASSFSRIIIEPVGPEVLTLKNILLKLRGWLDIPGERTISVPVFAIKIATTLGTLLRWPVVNGTALHQLLHGNAATQKSFGGLYAPAARSMDDVLLAHPAGVQDRWHARLALLAPFITAVLFLTWIASGLIGLSSGIAPAQETLKALSLNSADPKLLAWATSGWDIFLGLLILTPLRTSVLASLQILTVLAYTTVLSIAFPVLWLDAFGPLLKNVPVIILVGVWAAIRNRR